MGVNDFARCIERQVGKPYAWGTRGPANFDCSGLVAYCYEQTTHEPMTGSSVAQFTLGDPVAKGDPGQRGDLLFWDTFGAPPGHVAVDMGDGTMVHALNEQRGVIRSTKAGVNMGGNNHFMGARRLDFGDTPAPIPEVPPATDPVREKRPFRPRHLHRKRRGGRVGG